VGNARAALFNWLFGRHHHGTFILRIEDTDASRTTETAVEGTIEILRWLGIDWDEGPIRQSERRDLYRSAVERLLADGRAFECYCTEDELQARNRAAASEGRPPGYDGHCRDLAPEARAALAAEGRSHVVRFRTPDSGTSTFHDVIRGDVSVEWRLVPDFVIQRSDGSPIFFLANAVDDIDMEITHVIRGEDLLDSTHRVLALRAALGGGEPPVYAHLPLVVDAQTRAKLSKRHGDVAVEDYRALGYLPEALMNYLALLGWAPGGDDAGDEVLTSEELVDAFDLDRVTHGAAAFDRKKLDWLNGEWIRRLDLDDLVSRVEADARRAFAGRFDEATFRAGVAIAQERAVTLRQLVESMDFLFRPDEELEIAPDSWVRLSSTPGVDALFDGTISHLSVCDWTVEAIDLRPTIEALGMKPRAAMPALYAAVEGHHQGLPLFDSVWLLGRDRTLARLRAARARLA
jgi:glutamyl-tRNA synthetase